MTEPHTPRKPKPRPNKDAEPSRDAPITPPSTKRRRATTVQKPAGDNSDIAFPLKTPTKKPRLQVVVQRRLGLRSGGRLATPAITIQSDSSDSSDDEDEGTEYQPTDTTTSSGRRWLATNEMDTTPDSRGEVGGADDVVESIESDLNRSKGKGKGKSRASLAPTLRAVSRGRSRLTPGRQTPAAAFLGGINVKRVHNIWGPDPSRSSRADTARLRTPSSLSARHDFSSERSNSQSVEPGYPYRDQTRRVLSANQHSPGPSSQSHAAEESNQALLMQMQKLTAMVGGVKTTLGGLATPADVQHRLTREKIREDIEAAMSIQMQGMLRTADMDRLRASLQDKATSEDVRSLHASLQDKATSEDVRSLRTSLQGMARTEDIDRIGASFRDFARVGDINGLRASLQEFARVGDIAHLGRSLQGVARAEEVDGLRQMLRTMAQYGDMDMFHLRRQVGALDGKMDHVAQVRDLKGMRNNLVEHIDDAFLATQTGINGSLDKMRTALGAVQSSVANLDTNHATSTSALTDQMRAFASDSAALNTAFTALEANVAKSPDIDMLKNRLRVLGTGIVNLVNAAQNEQTSDARVQEMLQILRGEFLDKSRETQDLVAAMKNKDDTRKEMLDRMEKDNMDGHERTQQMCSISRAEHIEHMAEARDQRNENQKGMDARLTALSTNTQLGHEKTQQIVASTHDSLRAFKTATAIKAAAFETAFSNAHQAEQSYALLIQADISSLKRYIGSEFRDVGSGLDDTYQVVGEGVGRLEVGHQQIKEDVAGVIEWLESQEAEIQDLLGHVLDRINGDDETPHVVGWLKGFQRLFRSSGSGSGSGSSSTSSAASFSAMSRVATPSPLALEDAVDKISSVIHAAVQRLNQRIALLEGRLMVDASLETMSDFDSHDGRANADMQAVRTAREVSHLDHAAFRLQTAHSTADELRMRVATKTSELARAEARHVGLQKEVARACSDKQEAEHQGQLLLEQNFALERQKAELEVEVEVLAKWAERFEGVKGALVTEGAADEVAVVEAEETVSNSDLYN